MKILTLLLILSICLALSCAGMAGYKQQPIPIGSTMEYTHSVWGNPNYRSVITGEHGIQEIWTYTCLKVGYYAYYVAPCYTVYFVNGIVENVVYEP